MKPDMSMTIAPKKHDRTQKSSFYAGFVLYHPDSEHHVKSIRTLLSNGITVIVFDNSENKKNRETNRATLKNHFDAQLYYLESAQGNIGLAAAYNQIVSLAKIDKFASGLFLFDQDTDVDETALHHLIESFTFLQGLGQLGLVAGYPKRSNGISYRMRPRSMFQAPKPELIAVNFAASSFSLIPLSTLKTVGEFQEDFFIDYIDCDFCIRCWQQHLPVFVDTRATFLHRVGLGDVYMRKKPLFPIATPFRHYYLVRNMILSHSRANLPKFDLVRQVLLRIAIIFVIGIYTHSLFQRLKYTAYGVIDGIKGKTGRLV